MVSVSILAVTSRVFAVRLIRRRSVSSEMKMGNKMSDDLVSQIQLMVNLWNICLCNFGSEMHIKHLC